MEKKIIKCRTISIIIKNGTKEETSIQIAQKNLKLEMMITNEGT